MAKGDISALKDALCNQILITKKLYAELEEEREASATAATEALSMILRLQREKAEEKMEASQYKRMAEERINHAEESLNILEEVIRQKDLEIQSLQFQLKSDKQNKTSLGIKISDFAELILCENISCSNGISRRNASLPSLCGEDVCSHMRFPDDEDPILSSRRRIVENEEVEIQKYEAEEFSKNSAVGSCFSVISNEIQRRHSPIGSISSWCSTPTTDSTKRGGVKSDKEAIEDNENALSLERAFSGKRKYYALFDDLFEVPDNKSCKSGEFCEKLLQDTNFETNSIIRMPEEATDYLCEDEERPNKESMDSDIEQLRRRLQKLEDERVLLQEDSESGKKQMREMLKQLNAIETHIKIRASKKSSPAVEPSLVSIIEDLKFFSSNQLWRGKRWPKGHGHGRVGLVEQIKSDDTLSKPMKQCELCNPEDNMEWVISQKASKPQYQVAKPSAMGLKFPNRPTDRLRQPKELVNQTQTLDNKRTKLISDSSKIWKRTTLNIL